VRQLWHRRRFRLGIGFRCRFDIQQFYVEDQRGVSRNTRDASFAVSQIRWDDQLDFAAFLDVFQAFGPARDNAVQTEGERLTAGVGVIELFTVNQRTFVVNDNGVAVFRRIAGPFFLNFVQQARFRGFTPFSLRRCRDRLCLWLRFQSRLFPFSAEQRFSRGFQRPAESVRFPGRTVCSYRKRVLNTGDQLIFIQLDAQFSCSFREFSM
jgi:hypothetical protein